MSAHADGWLRRREGGIEIRVRLIPRASKNKIDGFHGDRLKLRLTAPPIAGEANRSLVRFLAPLCRIAPSKGKVVMGAQNRSKTVLFECDDPDQVAERLRRRVADEIS